MKDFIEFEAGAVCCDNCSYEKQDVIFKTVEDMRQWVGVPCPECGKSLMEEHHVQDFDNLLKLSETMNLGLKNIGFEIPENAEQERFTFDYAKRGKEFTMSRNTLKND